MSSNNETPKRSSETKDVLREKLAAVLRDLMVEVDGKLERAIPWEHARQMTAGEVLSLFHFDHNIYHVHNGPMKHWNLTARLIREHRVKTAQVDRPQIAKTGRINESHRAFQRKMLAKSGQAEPGDAPERAPAKSKSAWPSRKLPTRPFPKKDRRP